MTFKNPKDVPEMLKNCQQGDCIEIRLKLNGKLVGYTYADCDFMGLTPLFTSGDDAEVEYVILSGCWVGFSSNVEKYHCGYRPGGPPDRFLEGKRRERSLD